MVYNKGYVCVYLYIYIYTYNVYNKGSSTGLFDEGWVCTVEVVDLNLPTEVQALGP